MICNEKGSARLIKITFLNTDSVAEAVLSHLAGDRIVQASSPLSPTAPPPPSGAPSYKHALVSPLKDQVEGCAADRTRRVLSM